MTFTVSHSKKVTDFLQTIQKDEFHLVMDVRVTEKACFFGVEIIVKIVKKEVKNKKNMQDISVGGVILLISPEIIKYFPESKNLVLDLKGKLRKKIVCVNPKPIIKNICKI